MKEKLNEIKIAALEKLNQVSDLQALESLRVEILGKKGELTQILKGMGSLSKEERPVIGQLANEVRSEIEAKLETVKTAFEEKAQEEKLKAETIDVTMPGNTHTLGHRHPMTQVIDNIINNAIKYSPDGGKITVSMKTTETQMILSISDEGLGIPKKDLPKIFDRFYRVDKARSRAQGGSGLGLAIAKEIIKQHHGFIWAKSEYGKGSTFTIVLPYDKEAVKDDDWEEDELEG